MLIAALIALAGCGGDDSEEAPETPPAAAKAAGAPTSLASVWTVTNDNDSGPGSLRHAISNAAAGDRIEFAVHSSDMPGLSLPAVIPSLVRL